MIITSRRFNPEDKVDVDALGKLKDSLVGLYLTEVTRRENDWAFTFSEKIALRVDCPWRILVEGMIKFADDDDGQKFGLPAPLDGKEEVNRLLKGKVIQQMAIRSDISDLFITFSGQTVLEVMNMSCGYESWGIRTIDIEVIATGGGRLEICEDLNQK